MSTTSESDRIENGNEWEETSGGVGSGPGHWTTTVTGPDVHEHTETGLTAETSFLDPKNLYQEHRVDFIGGTDLPGFEPTMMVCPQGRGPGGRHESSGRWV